MLPADLRQSELQALQALTAALETDPTGRWQLDWGFEGLRILPVALRLLASLNRDQAAAAAGLLFADAGATALAQRESPELAEQIRSFRDQEQRQQPSPSTGVLLAVRPTQADYEGFEQLCSNHRGAVVMLNGALEDAAVGIGSVARQRRRGFLALWHSAYRLQPVSGGVLLHRHPGPWELYREDPDGHRLSARFEQRPDAEQLAEALGRSQGLAAMEGFLESLSR